MSTVSIIFRGGERERVISTVVHFIIDSI